MAFISGWAQMQPISGPGGECCHLDMDVADDDLDVDAKRRPRKQRPARGWCPACGACHVMWLGWSVTISLPPLPVRSVHPNTLLPPSGVIINKGHGKASAPHVLHLIGRDGPAEFQEI